MDKRIVYTNAAGGVSVIVPAPEMFNPQSKTRALLPRLKDATEEQILQFIIAKEGKATDFAIVDVADLPSREFRNAWKKEAGGVSHDMEKCRGIWKDKMRAARKPKLEALDTEYQRADESDDKAKKKEVAAKKQALRDVTADAKIAEAKTVDELKLVWPEALK
jgi:hypothetical protein